jgi:uncharacterized membrane protein YoaK (UPF0700 family)
VGDISAVDDASQQAKRPVHPTSQTRLRTSDIAREARIAGIDFDDETLSLDDETLSLSDETLSLGDETLAPLALREREPVLLPEGHPGIAEIELPGAPLPANSLSARVLESMRPHSVAMGNAHHVVGALFGAIAGYVDTMSFLTLFGMFTAHVTGDLVASVTDLSQGSMTTRVTMLPIFMLSVAVATVFARLTRRYSQAPLFPLLALMTAALLVFGATGIALRPFMTSHSNWAVSIVGATGVGAMAIQNMIMRDALNSWTPTTIMTGNLTQVTIQLVELAFAGRERDPQARARIRKEAGARLVKFGLPLAGFVAGAASGAVLTRLYGFWSVAVPAVVVGALTVWHWREGRR